MSRVRSSFAFVTGLAISGCAVSQGPSGDTGGGGESSSTHFDDEGGGGSDGCSSVGQDILLLTADRRLVTFDPTVEGLAAYQPLSQLDCPAPGGPASMAVARSGAAYLLYSNGRIYQADAETGACEATPYDVGGYASQGMGMTATEPNGKAETFYTTTPGVGLARVLLPSFQVSQLGGGTDLRAELSGGIDGRLFLLDETGTLSEIDRVTLAQTAVHRFEHWSAQSAIAVARHTGIFYGFAGTTPGNAVTFRYDPDADEESVRDQGLGFVVVGAGQSTCVPPPAVK